ncbi:unnamed protein product, partial [Amoebophrya sp. A25]
YRTALFKFRYAADHARNRVRKARRRREQKDRKVDRNILASSNSTRMKPDEPVVVGDELADVDLASGSGMLLSSVSTEAASRIIQKRSETRSKFADLMKARHFRVVAQLYEALMVDDTEKNQKQNRKERVKT